jgi:hypothetical protein
MFKWIGIVVFAAALVVVFALLMTFPTMWLVNYLFTPAVILSLFGTTALTFWKALWLNMFCGIIFKGYNYSSK